MLCNVEPCRWTLNSYWPFGPGAYEIRIHALGKWRVVYVAKFDDAVCVLHAFHKKTRNTRREDIELAALRYRQLGNVDG